MDAMLSWGLDIVRSVQVIASPVMTALMKAVSTLGTEWFYMAALSLVYWCVDRRRGARIAVVFLFSNFLNLWAKTIFAQPRPYQLDPKVGMAEEVTYGLPSNHAQGATVFWGTAARLFRKPWGLVLAIILPLIIGFSRVYLGVHFPTDVFAGWLLGAAIVAVDAFLGDRISAFIGSLDLRIKALAVAVIAFVMNALYPSDMSISALFLGSLLGFLLAEKEADFSVEGALGQRILRWLVGMAGALAIYLGLKLLFPGPGSDLYVLLRFVRYALVGAWFGFGAPWAFLRLKLARPAGGAAGAVKAG
jgi:membrane-associated phospholipid phosphatase